MNSTADDFLAARLANAEARLARIEAKLHGVAELDDAIQIDAAARFCGYSTSNFRKLLRSDVDLARCGWRGAGRSARWVFSRGKLESWKRARS